jgi:putative Ca2+/H+ antiporter (TMEM165/GDT1 family)
MEALWVSIGLVTLAEIGDKTQLLSLLLAARYRRPVPIIFGILVHALAAALGSWITGAVGPQALRWSRSSSPKWATRRKSPRSRSPRSTHRTSRW